MKLFRPNVATAVRALQAIFTEGQYADKAVEAALKSSPKLGARDRAFIAETIYEVVRRYRFLYEILGHEPRHPREWWALTGIWLRISTNAPLPEWEEFQALSQIAIHDLFRSDLPRAIRESVPDWLDERGAAELGERWPDLLHQLNQPAAFVIRANTLKITRSDLAKQIAAAGIGTRSTGEAGLVLDKRINLFQSEWFQSGLFEVQDASSQEVAPFLAPEPGMRVVDACAGGGGKTLHLAALMENKGSIIALDPEDWKLEELKRRARRAGAHQIQTRPITDRKVIKRLYGTADRLLLDVPCSGLGVLRRNPDTKWKLSPALLAAMQEQQQSILSGYARIVKPGGRLVYATCSILESENGAQVRRFLEADDAFELADERSILPDDQGFDGFYMAALTRKGA
ncbi:MAG: RNA methyltransferase [Bacteroidia bacterium]|nr:RNA methyltransferase [Bacteroidia bacterium]